MNYILVERYKYYDFLEEVNRQIENGYTLVGGVSFTVNNYGTTTYIQALIKE